MNKELTNSTDGMLLGLCSGIAEYLEVPSSYIQLLFILLLAFMFDNGFILLFLLLIGAYIVFAVALPYKEEEDYWIVYSYPKFARYIGFIIIFTVFCYFLGNIQTATSFKGVASITFGTLVYLYLGWKLLDHHMIINYKGIRLNSALGFKDKFYPWADISGFGLSTRRSKGRLYAVLDIFIKRDSALYQKVQKDEFSIANLRHTEDEILAIANWMKANYAPEEASASSIQNDEEEDAKAVEQPQVTIETVSPQVTTETVAPQEKKTVEEVEKIIQKEQTEEDKKKEEFVAAYQRAKAESDINAYKRMLEEYDDEDDETIAYNKKMLFISIALFALLYYATRHSNLQTICQFFFDTALYVPMILCQAVLVAYIVLTLAIVHYYWGMYYKGGLITLLDCCFKRVLPMRGILVVLLLVFTLIGEVVAYRVQDRSIIVKSDAEGRLSCYDYWLVAETIDGQERGSDGFVINETDDTLCVFRKVVHTVESGEKPEYHRFECILPHSKACVMTPYTYFGPTPDSYVRYRGKDKNSTESYYILDKLSDVKSHHNVTYEELLKTTEEPITYNNMVNSKGEGLTYYVGTFSENAYYEGGWEVLKEDLRIDLGDSTYYYNEVTQTYNAKVDRIVIEFDVMTNGDIKNIKNITEGEVPMRLIKEIDYHLRLTNKWVPAKRGGHKRTQRVRMTLLNNTDASSL